MKLKLIQTCGACPEQYDVFTEDEMKVGYLRLRHGYFSARYPNSSGIEVYGSETVGDGSFISEEERKLHLKRAKKAIKKELKKEN